jgi:hypothetical protein
MDEFTGVGEPAERYGGEAERQTGGPGQRESCVRTMP